jgi:hypothetical protein
MPMLRRGLLFAIAVVAACFSESSLSEGGSGSGGDDCAVGSEGCACTVGDSCDGDLECLQPASVCVQPGCTPGAGLCSCDEGTCESTYVCTQNFCAPMDGSEGSSGTTMSSGSSDPSTTQFLTTSSAEEGSSGSVADDTSGPGSSESSAGSVSSVSSESSTTGAAQTCHECLNDAQLGMCSDEYGACPTCEGLLWMCVIGQESTFAECCARFEGALPAGWNTFAGCVDTACSDICDPLTCG